VLGRLRPHEHDGLKALGQLAQLLQRGLELQCLLGAIARVRRLARRAEAIKLALGDDRARITARGRELPRLALGDSEQPAAPVAIAIRLVAEELHPRIRARVLDVLSRRAHSTSHVPHQAIVVREEELRLVAAEP
jgi:hypothetical protein